MNSSCKRHHRAGYPLGAAGAMISRLKRDSTRASSFRAAAGGFSGRGQPRETKNIGELARLAYQSSYHRHRVSGGVCLRFEY